MLEKFRKPTPESGPSLGPPWKYYLVASRHAVCFTRNPSQAAAPSTAMLENSRKPTPEAAPRNLDLQRPTPKMTNGLSKKVLKRFCPFSWIICKSKSFRSPVGREVHHSIFYYWRLRRRLFELLPSFLAVPREERKFDKACAELDEQLKGVQGELQAGMQTHHHPLQVLATGHSALEDKAG